MKDWEGISSSDIAFDPLAHVQRRKLLVALLEGEPRDEVTVVRTDSDGEYSVTERRLPISQEHLSELAEYGFVEWDSETQEVSTGQNFDEISPLLESLTNHGDEPAPDWR
ncbi:ArsR family transcriptional regulator [Halostella sp. JP-L12]|uniref:ArsR family transcriptional regulator n=1 Tax=Halostella TaxID=1843185 RepID=UPI000EF7728B|nr:MULTISPECIES: ArsR family transcriptional regulator [Halostella]NHN48105.1 ArsR family transcriptional regulator [Halostella sp. JP-L12]